LPDWVKSTIDLWVQLEYRLDDCFDVSAGQATLG
jgi:hypothetical protein